MLEAKILNKYRTAAIVGLSPDPSRPSHRVASYLDMYGYKVIPVNPMLEKYWARQATLT